MFPHSAICVRLANNMEGVGVTVCLLMVSMVMKKLYSDSVTIESVTDSVLFEHVREVHPSKGDPSILGQTDQGVHPSRGPTILRHRYRMRYITKPRLYAVKPNLHSYMYMYIPNNNFILYLATLYNNVHVSS